MIDELTKFKQMRQFDFNQMPQIDSNLDQQIADVGNQRSQKLQLRLKAINNARGEQNAEMGDYTASSMADYGQMGEQGAIIPTKAPLTQRFGNRSSVESFSGGVNLGADFGIKRGTPLALPPGKWQVIGSFSGAKEGDRGANKGSGNLVKVRNMQTGEMLAFEHLDKVNVGNGQVLNGGTVIGLSGNTGNSTGPHASIPYQDAEGKYKDVLQSPYARYLFGS